MQSFFYTVAIIINDFHLPYVSVPWVIGSVLLIGRKSTIDGVVLFTATVVAWLVSNAVKLVFALARPPHPLVDVATYSFPSTHAAVAGAFFGSICISTFTLTQKIIPRMVSIGLLIGGTLLVDWSRVFLQVHFPVDVIAGTIVGIFTALGAHSIVRQVDSYRNR